MKVRDVMSGGVISIDRRESAAAAARMLRRAGIGALPVTDGGKLVGMLTDRDIALRCVAEGGAHLSAGGVMTRGALTTSPEAELAEAARVMGRGRVRRLPVVEDGRVVGMLSLGDIARASSVEAAAALAEISSPVLRLSAED